MNYLDFIEIYSMHAY